MAASTRAAKTSATHSQTPLEHHDRLHVCAFIAGGWSLNPLAESSGLTNLATVVYDRSPLQERAARIATDHLRFLTYGTPVFDLARPPDPPFVRPGVRVAILVETRPTTFVSRRAKVAWKYGPLRFDCDSFAQSHDDCAFVAMNHDQMYQRFPDVLPEVLSFIRTGRFSSAAAGCARLLGVDSGGPTEHLRDDPAGGK